MPRPYLYLVLLTGCSPPVPHAGAGPTHDAGPRPDIGVLTADDPLLRGPVSAQTPTDTTPSGSGDQTVPADAGLPLVDCIEDGTYRVLQLACGDSVVPSYGLVEWTFSEHGRVLRTPTAVVSVECTQPRGSAPQMTFHGVVTPAIPEATSTWTAWSDGPRCILMRTTTNVACGPSVGVPAMLDLDGPY